ncbi:23120_t:CDS:2, partial [Racocetra persica]
PQKSKLFREKGVQTNLEAEKSSEIEKEAKRFSEEKIRNLQEDIQNLNQEKQELIEKIKELENGKSILTKEEQEFIDFVVSNFNFEDYEQMKSAISDLSETLGERFEKQEETSFPNLKQIRQNGELSISTLMMQIEELSLAILSLIIKGDEEVIKKIKENIKLAHDFLLLLPKIEASKEGSESEEE